MIQFLPKDNASFAFGIAHHPNNLVAVIVYIEEVLVSECAFHFVELAGQGPLDFDVEGKTLRRL